MNAFSAFSPLDGNKNSNQSVKIERWVVYLPHHLLLYLNTENSSLWCWLTKVILEMITKWVSVLHCSNFYFDNLICEHSILE